MQIVILSAGDSTRFSEAGFPLQKCLLPMPDGRTLLEWQARTLPNEKILFVSKMEYQKSQLTMIIRMKARYDLKATWVKKITRGPLDTLWYVRKFLNLDEQILILYNDALIETETMIGFLQACEKSNYDSAVVCFDSPDERFTRIPGTKGLACGSTFYFKSGKALVKAMKGRKRKENNGVPDMVYSFQKWLPFYLGKNEFVELGTPEDYRLWMAEKGHPVEKW